MAKQIEEPKSRLRLGISALCLLIAVAPIARAAAPAPSSPAGHAVQLEHWYASYPSSTPAPAPTFPQFPDNGSGFSPPPLPSLSTKYPGITPVGLTDFVNAEYTAVRKQLSAGQMTATSGWTIQVTACSHAEPVLLTAVNHATRTICIAPLLVSSIFFQAAGTSLEELKQHLQSWQVDPATFSGDYDPSLASRGETSADWASYLSAYEPIWSELKTSIDFSLLEQLNCEVLDQPKPACETAALTTTRQMNGSSDIHALTISIENAASKYDPSSWGFTTGGDGAQVGGAFSTLGAPSP